VFTLERPCYKHERSGLSATDMNTDDTESIRLSPVCTSLWQVPTCLVVCPLGRAVVSFLLRRSPDRLPGLSLQGSIDRARVPG